MCQLVETDEGNSGEFAGKQRGDLCRCGTMGPLLQRCKYPESLQTDLSLSLFLSPSALILLDLSSSLVVRCLYPVHFRSCNSLSKLLRRRALATIGARVFLGLRTRLEAYARPTGALESAENPVKSKRP